jgi:hypothetical protein
MGPRRWCLGKCEKPSTTECTEEHREKQHRPRLTTHSATLSAGYGHEGTQREPLEIGSSGRRVIGETKRRRSVLLLGFGYSCWLRTRANVPRTAAMLDTRLSGVVCFPISPRWGSWFVFLFSSHPLRGGLSNSAPFRGLEFINLRQLRIA